MSEKCSELIWNKWSRSRFQCENKAKVEREGRPYCGTHDPERIKAKRAERAAKWNAKWDAKDATRKRDSVILKACQGLTAEQVEHAINEWKALYAK